MKYPENSFYHNFVGVFQSKDTEITKDLLFSEIGWLIVNKKKDVIAMLNEVGIKTNKKAGDKEIVDTIINNQENKRLHIGIAYLISEKNKEEYSNFDLFGVHLWGAKKPTGTGATTTTGGGSGNVVSSIAEAVGSIFGFAKSVKDAKAQKESDQAALLQATLAYKASMNGNKKSNTGLYIILGVVAVVGIIGIYMYYKKVSTEVATPTVKPITPVKA